MKSVLRSKSENQSWETFWENVGFLEGLNGKARQVCIESYTKMALYILNENPREINAMGFQMSLTVFPIIRRVVTNEEVLQPLVDPEAFYEFCMQFIAERVDHYEKVMKMSHVDIEAVACREISTEAIRIITDND